jgi:microcystin-dependent protein
MGQPYVGEIRMFAGNFAPAGWLFCDGSLLSISEYETLFQLIGTTYGGDGQETFALPNLSGRVPIHQGASQGGSTHVIGEASGVEEVTLTPSQIPQHTHLLPVATSAGSSESPVGGIPAASPADVLWGRGQPTQPMTTTSQAGGSQPHPNLQPYTCLNYIISLFGVFPSPT